MSTKKSELYIVDIVFADPYSRANTVLRPRILSHRSERRPVRRYLWQKAARAYAFLHQRGYVIPEDVISVCHDVLRHRIGLTYEAEANNFTTDMIITEILDKVQVPDILVYLGTISPLWDSNELIKKSSQD